MLARGRAEGRIEKTYSRDTRDGWDRGEDEEVGEVRGTQPVSGPLASPLHLCARGVTVAFCASMFSTGKQNQW